MLTISVEFLHGVMRAGSADDTALTGLPDTGEWPPSPSRLFSALVAGDGTGPRCRGTDGSELVLLEGAGPPIIRADGLGDVTFTNIRTRFAVVDEKNGVGVQNYPARKSKAVHPGTRMSPKHPVVSFWWPDVVPTARQLIALAYRAARVPYLGCADSPARIRVSTDRPDDALGMSDWIPAADGAVSLPVPYPGFLDALDRSFEQFTAGNGGGRSWIASPRQAYSDPDSVASDDESAPIVYWLRLGEPIAPRHLLALTTTLRNAVLAYFGDDAPAVLHGHGAPTRGFEQARFLGLPEAGSRYSSGRIRGVAVWLPPGCDPDIVSGVDQSLRNTNRLYNGSGLDVPLARFDGTKWPWASNPKRWIGPARHWSSVFPVVFERHPKGVPTLAEIARWCAHAGIPGPIHARVSSVPLIRGAANLRPEQVFRAGKAKGPYAHIELSFADPVAGPVVLGRARQLGLGLMAPLDSDGSSS